MKNRAILITGLTLSIMTSMPFVRVTHSDEVENKGHNLFMSKGCIACHQIQDRGGEIGPHLDGVGLRHDKEWIVQQIKDPHSHKIDGKMPKPILTDGELADLIAYLMTLK